MLAKIDNQKKTLINLFYLQKLFTSTLRTETPFNCDKNRLLSLHKPLYGFRTERKEAFWDIPRTDLHKRGVHRLPNFSRQISGDCPYIYLVRARCGRVIARNGICVAPGRSRPTAVSGIARSHQCPPSPVARRRPPSAVSTHASSFRVAHRDSAVAGTPRVVPWNPRAPYTAYATLCGVDNPREDLKSYPEYIVFALEKSQWIVTISIALVRWSIYLSK